MQQGKVILARYHTKQALSQAYMSFTRDGGLFVSTSDEFAMHEPVFLIVVLPDNNAVMCACGQVSWFGHGRKQGIGVHFHADEGGRQLRHAIESGLGALLGSPAQPLTM